MDLLRQNFQDILDNYDESNRDKVLTSITGQLLEQYQFALSKNQMTVGLPFAISQENIFVRGNNTNLIILTPFEYEVKAIRDSSDIVIFKIPFEFEFSGLIGLNINSVQTRWCVSYTTPCFHTLSAGNSLVRNICFGEEVYPEIPTNEDDFFDRIPEIKSLLETINLASPAANAEALEAWEKRGWGIFGYISSVPEEARESTSKLLNIRSLKGELNDSQ